MTERAFFVEDEKGNYCNAYNGSSREIYQSGIQFIYVPLVFIASLAGRDRPIVQLGSCLGPCACWGPAGPLWQSKLGKQFENKKKHSRNLILRIAQNLMFMTAFHV